MTAIGLVFAARRIIYDFRRGLRYLDPPTKPHPPQLDFGQFGDSTPELGVASGGITQGIEQPLD